jgi:hypothetical protein
VNVDDFLRDEERDAFVDVVSRACSSSLLGAARTYLLPMWRLEIVLQELERRGIEVKHEAE